jgi:hypothetical protein
MANGCSAPRPHRTMGQLLDLSEELSVSLINHRRLGGWGRSTPGTVVTRTAGPGPGNPLPGKDT